MNDREKEKLDIAIYIRVANKENENLEIENQKIIIDNYLKEKFVNIEHKEYYIDIGYSGNNYLRPEYQRMLDDIRKQKVNAVIVKDLSRISRKLDILESTIWRENKVEFIAIDNKIDTINNKKVSNMTLKFIKLFYESEKEEMKKRRHHRKHGDFEK